MEEDVSQEMMSSELSLPDSELDQSSLPQGSIGLSNKKLDEVSPISSPTQMPNKWRQSSFEGKRESVSDENLLLESQTPQRFKLNLHSNDPVPSERDYDSAADNTANAKLINKPADMQSWASCSPTRLKKHKQSMFPLKRGQTYSFGKGSLKFAPRKAA